MSHRILISAFSISGMRTAVPIAVQATKNVITFLDSKDPNNPVDIAKIMTGITFDGVCLPGIPTSTRLLFPDSRDLLLGCHDITCHQVQPGC